MFSRVGDSGFGVFFEPFRVALIGVVGIVHGVVDEEGFVLVIFHEGAGFFDHEIGGELTVHVDFFAVAVEVVLVGAGPVKEVGVIVDTSAHVTEGVVEALRVGHGFGGVAEVPFPDVCRGVSGFFHHFGDGDLFGGHTAGTFS